MRVTCPVCRRPVEATDTTGRVWSHNDTARGMCQMTGHCVPIEDEHERRAAA